MPYLRIIFTTAIALCASSAIAGTLSQKDIDIYINSAKQLQDSTNPRVQALIKEMETNNWSILT